MHFLPSMVPPQSQEWARKEGDFHRALSEAVMFKPVRDYIITTQPTVANGWACPAFGPTTSETTTNSTIWIVFQPEIVYGLCLPPVEHHTFSFANYYNFGLIDHSWWTWFYINVFVQLVRVPRGDAQLCTPKICEKQKAWGWCAEFWSHINMISCVSPCES